MGSGLIHHLAGEDGFGLYGQLAVHAVHGEGVAAAHLIADDLPADESLHRVLHEAAQGPGAEGGVVGAVDDELLGRRGEGHGELLVRQAAVELGHQQVDDVGDVVAGQGLVEHDLVQTVEELRPEGAAEQLLHLASGRFGDLAIGVDAVQQILGAQVGGEDDDGVLEVHRPALTVRNPAVIQYL